jgi:hypothetical protein
MSHPKRPTDIHHRINRKTGHGIRAYPIRVNKRLHEFFHALFGYKDVYQIAKDLNENWIPPDYELIVVKKEQSHEMTVQEILGREG